MKFLRTSYLAASASWHRSFRNIPITGSAYENSGRRIQIIPCLNAFLKTINVVNRWSSGSMFTMTTNPPSCSTVQASNDTSRSATIFAKVFRWIARLWGIASALLLLAFAFGGGEHLRFNTPEALAFLFFPVGIIAGFAIAWRRELTGGLVTVGSYLVICLYLSASDGRWPNVYFFLFSAPGFLHVASSMLARRNAIKRRAA